MRALLLLLALPLFTGCETGRPADDPEPGVAWSLAQERAATLTDLRYEVEMTIPEARTEAVRGAITLHFNRRTGDRDLVIDFNQPAAQVLAVHTLEAALEYRVINGHIVVPAEAVPAGPHSVTVDFVAGESALNRNDDFLYTLFVPDRAHFVLPLFDQPNLKARYRLTLHVPAGWQAVANGALNERTETATGATYHFAETRPISTYLFAFAAGRFQAEAAMRDGRSMTMYHRETDAAKVARNRDAIFDLHAAALAWLENYTGLPYPFEKFDFVLIPAFQYGGMEHPGSILYRQSSLMLDASATQNQQLGRASLIAHETAHMWFGDLVTMNWFDDVWTKEVFANFMAAKIVNPSFPDVDHDLRFLLAHYPAAYGVDRTAGANPIRQPLENLQQAGTLYGAIIYQKAPIVMKQLERLVGEDAFREGLQTYLRQFQYGNATWPDLIDILDARSEEDLKAWSQVWVEEAGRPTIRTHLETDAQGRIAALRLEQADPRDEGRRWTQQLEVLLAYPDTLHRLPVLLDAAVVDVPAAAGRPAPDFILPNGRGLGYGLFVLDPASRDFLAAHLPAIDDPFVRGAAWVTLWEAFLDGQLAPEALAELALDALATETDELNTQRLTGALTSLYWRYLPAAARAAWAPRLEAIFWERLASAAGTTLKSTFFNAYRDVVLTDDGVARLRAVWAEEQAVPGLTFSERDFTAMAEALALRGVPDAEAILDAQAGRITNPDRQARFAFVRPALSADPAVRDAFFGSLRDDANRAHEPWVLAGVRSLHHPLRAPEAERYIRPSLELVEEIQRTGDIFFPKRWLDATLDGHNTATAAAAVRQFLDGLPADYPHRLRGKIEQSADGLFRAADATTGSAATPGTDAAA